MRTVLLALAVSATSAAAETHDVDVSGFVTYGPGDLAGTVTDLEGAPLGGVKVRVAAGSAPEAVITTNAKGAYRVKLTHAGATYVYVEANVKITGQLASAVKEGGYEAIAIRETLPPVVPPKSKSGSDVVPEYSAKAEDKNQWTRAWLLLDVTETGKVRRVKLLNAPGLDLDAIAVREAFKIPFEPARDRANAPVPALVLWTWEWPAYYWMIEHRERPSRLPALAHTMPCKNAGGTKAVRDCAKPAVAKAITLPWIDKSP